MDSRRFRRQAAQMRGHVLQNLKDTSAEIDENVWWITFRDVCFRARVCVCVCVRGEAGHTWKLLFRYLASLRTNTQG